MKNTFIIDKNKIIENYQKYKKYGNVYYPLKTNSNPEIIKILYSQFDKKDKFMITNKYQLNILLDLNIPTNQIGCMNSLNSFYDIVYYYSKGIKTFTVEDINVIKLMKKYNLLDKLKLIIRLSVDSFFNTFSYLGASIDKAKKMINIISKYTNNYGISFYLPQNIQSYKNINKCIRIIHNSFGNLKFINIGGIPYDKIQLKNYNYKINIETGKSLLYNSINLSTEIVKIKNNNIPTVIINNGIFSGFLDVYLYNKKFDIISNIKIYNKKHKDCIKFILCGDSGDSKDILGEYYIKRKDYNKFLKLKNITVLNIGAYFEELYAKYSKDKLIHYIIKE